MCSTAGEGHLSQIETVWSLVLEAHQAPASRRSEAMSQLLRRYGRAVERYLLATAGDADVAADLSQELALRLVRGDFRSASPGRGRFRQMIKTAALNLVADHFRRTRKWPSPLSAVHVGLEAISPTPEDLEREFQFRWRTRLLGVGWSSLRRHQERTSRPFYTVLRTRVENPEMNSTELASQLTLPLGRQVTAGWVRQTLLRARERFAASLLAEVSRSLEDPSAEALEAELIELGLLAYCRKHLGRFGLGE